MIETIPLWTPSAEAIASANVTRFIRDVVQPLGGDAARIGDTSDLYQWSVADPEQFWSALWRFCGVIADERPGAQPWDAVLEHGDRMAPPDPVLGPRWFRGARLNFAENLLRRRDDVDALVLWTERGPGRRLSFAHDAAGREVERHLGDAVALRQDWDAASVETKNWTFPLLNRSAADWRFIGACRPSCSGLRRRRRISGNGNGW